LGIESCTVDRSSGSIALIDDSVLRQLEAAAAFAPLHIPPALSIIRFAQEHFPGLPQAACFDTTFHAGLAEVARVLPIAKALQSEDIQRYGFHGLSCQSIMHQLASDPPNRLIIAHLGNGASITAVRRGKSIDTTMGLTPTGGVIMGTRSGDLDPGILIYLVREKKFDAESFTTSPGTSSAAGMVTQQPSRWTDALSASRDFSAARVAWARPS
jgi:acetate kinase